jgi:DNA repair exonuclease SbcCD ATPase subunit
MTTLFENLPILNAAVPTLADKVSDAAAHGQAYREAVEAYLDRLPARRAEIAELTQQVQQALESVKDRAAAERGVLAGGVKELDAALEQGLEDLDESRDRVQEGLRSAAAAMKALQEKLADAAERAREAEEQTSSRFEALRGGLDSGRSELDGFVDTAGNAADGLEGELAEAQQSVAAAADVLEAKMTVFATEHVAERLDETAERLRQLQHEHHDAVGGAIEALGEGSKAVGDDVREKVAEDVTPPVTRGLEEIAEAMGTLGEKAAEARQSCQSAREDLDRQLDALRQRFPSLEAALEAVRQAALQNGVSWPRA